MDNSFWRSVLSSFLKIENGISLFLATLITLILWNFTSKDKISINIFLVIVFITLVATGVLFQVAYNAFRENKQLKLDIQSLQKKNQDLESQIQNRIIPKILRVEKDHTTGLITCLLEDSELFSPEIMISFFYTDDDGFERQIGGGYVKNRQSDKKMTAVIDQPDSTYQNILDKLTQNDNKVLERTIIKPGTRRTSNPF